MGHFWKNMCHQELSKMAQSGHTEISTPDWVQIFSSYIMPSSIGERNIINFLFGEKISFDYIEKGRKQNQRNDVGRYAGPDFKKKCCVNAPFSRYVTLFFISSVFIWLLRTSVPF